MSLSERSLGWLRYLHRKAHTPDNWDRGGAPHPHWDDRSEAPMASWHRFDLEASSYAMGLMAHRTPAWTEQYVAILDQLIERHTGWWSAADWLTQFGHDPDQAAYPVHVRPSARKVGVSELPEHSGRIATSAPTEAVGQRDNRVTLGHRNQYWPIS